VKGAKRLGVRAGNWLGREQAEQLLALPDRSTLAGKRDRVVLALLLGGGLRREELATLTIAHVQQRENRWCLVDLEGKGKRLFLPNPSKGSNWPHCVPSSSVSVRDRRQKSSF
jgi:site-specific recombinase XerD